MTMTIDMYKVHANMTERDLLGKRIEVQTVDHGAVRGPIIETGVGFVWIRVDEGPLAGKRARSDERLTLV